MPHPLAPVHERAPQGGRRPEGCGAAEAVESAAEAEAEVAPEAPAHEHTLAASLVGEGEPIESEAPRRVRRPKAQAETGGRRRVARRRATRRAPGARPGPSSVRWHACATAGVRATQATCGAHGADGRDPALRVVTIEPCPNSTPRGTRSTPPTQGWQVGRPYCMTRPGRWEQYAFDPTERPSAGKRSREWIAVGATEVACVREMARCLRELREGRWPR